MPQLWFKKGEAQLQTNAKSRKRLEDMGWEVVEEKKVAKNTNSKPEKVRARDDKGHFVKDDPDTPENEAWTEKKPKKKSDK